MRVVHLNHWYDPDLGTPEVLLDRYRTLTGWSEALQAEGVQVTVLQRFREDTTFERKGVKYVFLTDAHRPHLRKWQVPFRLHQELKRLCLRADVQGEASIVHFNSLSFPIQLRYLRKVLPAGSPIVAQDHADRPWPGLRGVVQKWGLGAADGFFFAATEAGRPWVECGLIRNDQPIYQVMEGSTEFQRQDRTAARARTGISGNPVFLWVGRLIALKDPLTVLSGFREVLRESPGARLYMVYSSHDLLPQVHTRLSADTTLAGSVTLLGQVPHAKLELFYNSADYFVLGSHFEGSGYALAEALACGVVPVVTDIPAFRIMTNGGSIGALWRPGHAAEFAEAVLDIMRRPVRPLAEQAIRFFEDHLSWAAVGRKAMMAYRELAAKRAGPKR